jgi:hypothetical protein
LHGIIKALPIFIQGIDTDLMAEMVKGMSEFQGVNHAAPWFGGIDK